MQLDWKPRFSRSEGAPSLLRNRWRHLLFRQGRDFAAPPLTAKTPPWAGKSPHQWPYTREPFDTHWARDRPRP
jgi:hypothetical protein